MIASSPARARRVPARAQSGQGYFGLFVTLLVLAAGGFVALQAVPVYVHNFELQDYAHSLAENVAVDRVPPASVPSEVVARAQQLNLPVTADDVTMPAGEAAVKIRIRYTVPVDLKFYTWSLHFTISASAPRLVY